MKINSLAFCISILIVCRCYASSQSKGADVTSTLSGKGMNDNNHVRIDHRLAEASDLSSYDFSKEGPCIVCSSLSSMICSKCKKLFYCSRKCQNLHYKEHKRKCDDYYNKKLIAKGRKRYNTFLASYDSLNFFQYLGKSQQIRCIDFYLKEQEEEHDFIMPKDLKWFIFLTCHAPPEDSEFQDDFRTSFHVDMLGFFELELSSDHPMYLVRFLQYIYQKEASHQVVDERLKKCLLIRMACMNSLLAYLFCFELQRKFMAASMKVIKEEDWKMLYEMSSNERWKYMPSGIGPYPPYWNHSRIDSWHFWFILKKGEQKGLQYSSIAGWIHLEKELKKHNHSRP